MKTKFPFLQGKVAIITGSGQGLGKAFAKQLLMRGAKVFLIFCLQHCISYFPASKNVSRSSPGLSVRCENRNWFEDLLRT